MDSVSRRGTFEQMRSLIATMQTVLPTSFWNLFDGLEYCARLAAKAERPSPIERIRERLRVQATVSANLAPVGIRSADDVLACYVMGPKRILEFTDRASIVTDESTGSGVTTCRRSCAPSNRFSWAV